MLSGLQKIHHGPCQRAAVTPVSCMHSRGVLHFGARDPASPLGTTAAATSISGGRASDHNQKSVCWLHGEPRRRQSLFSPQSVLTPSSPSCGTYERRPRDNPLPVEGMRTKAVRSLLRDMQPSEVFFVDYQNVHYDFFDALSYTMATNASSMGPLASGPSGIFAWLFLTDGDRMRLFPSPSTQLLFDAGRIAVTAVWPGKNAADEELCHAARLADKIMDTQTRFFVITHDEKYPFRQLYPKLVSGGRLCKHLLPWELAHGAQEMFDSAGCTAEQLLSMRRSSPPRYELQPGLNEAWASVRCLGDAQFDHGDLQRPFSYGYWSGQWRISCSNKSTYVQFHVP